MDRLLSCCSLGCERYPLLSVYVLLSCVCLSIAVSYAAVLLDGRLHQRDAVTTESVMLVSSL